MIPQNLLELIAPILLLISLMTIILVVLIKFGDKIFDNGYQAETILIFIAAFLFVIILVTHLFEEQLWTEDTLKIIIGVLIGAGSSKVSKTNSLNFSNINAENFAVALRDINQKIDNFNSEVTNIKDAIVNQYPVVEKKLDEIKHQPVAKMQKPYSHSFEVKNDEFMEKLRLIQKQNNGNWALKWIEECIKFPEIHKEILEVILDLQNKGWTVIYMVFDNNSEGIIVNFSLEKPFV
jgi:hypothetical protein